MAHPNRKTSKTRRDKRRTHDSLKLPTLSKSPTTGTVHCRHTAYEIVGSIYNIAKLVIDKNQNE